MNQGFKQGMAVLGIVLGLAAGAVGAQPAAGFTVRDMRVEGLQRIAEGTVFNYLPVSIGDTMDGSRVAESIRALVGTGLFSDVEMRRDGDTLVVVVRERPSIRRLTITGNRDIKTEDLEQSLRGVGLARGRTFDRPVLEDVQQFLTEQYFSRGRYSVVVDTKLTEDEAENTVDIAVEIKEGERARIRQVTIVGNEVFSDEELRSGMKLRTRNWLSWYRQDDRYSRETLVGDLEALQSFYMDRGYANFDVDSTQVQISPDRQGIYVTINVSEGEPYRIAELRIAGNMVVWTYAGVRPLYDDGASKAQAATRDYVLKLDAPEGAAPLLNIFGGKITTYRKLAESALALLKPHLPGMGKPWTEGATLPGGDFPVLGFADQVAALRAAHPYLAESHARRLVRAYGTKAAELLDGVTDAAGLGIHFGSDLYEREVAYLMDREWARAADDVLWRRSKLGLRLTKEQAEALDGWMRNRQS